MKTIAIIGSHGMLGSDLLRYLNPTFDITPIHRGNYRNHVGNSFDVVINANGNSKRYWANQHPLDDFAASTVSVYHSVFDFPCKIYIYISSPDVYETHSVMQYTKEESPVHSEKLVPYGFHKYLSELIVQRYANKFLVLRCSLILGTNLKKGPFYDIISNNSVFITRRSRLQLITTNAVTKIIEVLLDGGRTNEIINVGGHGAFAFLKINKYFNKQIQFSPEAQTQRYEMNVEKIKKLFPGLKTSEEYLQEFLNEKKRLRT